MDFPSLLVALRDGNEHFPEANEQLVKMAQENSGEFISNLLNIITTSDDLSFRLCAINCLTIPAKRRVSTFSTIIDLTNIPNEAIKEMTDVLTDLLYDENELGDAAFKVLSFFYNLTNHSSIDLFVYLMNYFTEDNGRPLTVNYMKLLESLSSHVLLMPPAKLQAIITLTEFISHHEQIQDEIKSYYLRITATLIGGLLPTPDDTQQLLDIYTYIWGFIEQFPKDVCACFVSALNNTPLIVAKLPDFPDQVFELLQTIEDIEFRASLITLIMQKPMVLSNGNYEICNIVSEGREADLLSLMIDFLINDDSEEVVEFDSYLGKCRTAIAILIGNVQNKMIDYLQFSLQHITSEIVGERDVSTVLFSQCIACTLTFDKSLAEASTFVTFPLQDPTPRVIILGLYLLQTLSFKPNFKLEPHHLELVVSSVCSEIESISLDATQCLFTILPKVSDEMRIDVAGQIFNRAREIEDDNIRAELLRSLSQLANGLTADIACEIMPEALALTNELLPDIETSQLPISLSPCIGFLSSLFNQAGQQASEYSEPLLSLAVNLIENDMISDGITILSPLVMLFGEENKELMDMAITVVSQFLPNAKSEDDLFPVVKFCEKLLPHIDSYETCDAMFNTCLNYGLSQECSENLKCELVVFFVDLFNIHPEIVQTRVLDVFTVIFTAPFAANRPNLLHFVTSCAQLFIPGQPIFEKALESVVCELSMTAMKQQINTDDLLILTQLVSSFVQDPTNLLNNIAFTYRKYIQSYTSQEINEQISELIPEEIPPTSLPTITSKAILFL